MREIKFRQWHKRRKRMSCNIGIVKDGHWQGPESVTFSEDPIMQYTGLRDKNGVEIYEGDIVKYWADEFSEVNHAVEYIGGRWFPLVRVEYGYNVIDVYDNTLFEVIGNIYEHPELLK